LAAISLEGATLFWFKDGLTGANFASGVREPRIGRASVEVELKGLTWSTYSYGGEVLDIVSDLYVCSEEIILESRHFGNSR